MKKILYTFFFAVFTSLAAHADGILNCVETDENVLFSEQTLNVYPPIKAGGKRIEKVKVRTSLSIILNPSLGREEFSYEVKVYLGDMPNHIILANSEKRKKQTPVEVLSQLDELKDYNMDCVVDFTDKLKKNAEWAEEEDGDTVIYDRFERQRSTP